MASGAVDSVQTVVNIFDSRALDCLAPCAASGSVALLARGVLDESGLAGAVGEDTEFAVGDFRREFFTARSRREYVERIDELREWVPGTAPSLAALAIRFVLSQPQVTCAIVSMQTEDLVRENMALLNEEPLPHDVVDRLAPRDTGGRETFRAPLLAGIARCGRAREHRVEGRGRRPVRHASAHAATWVPATAGCSSSATPTSGSRAAASSCARTSSAATGELIFYLRADESGLRSSSYWRAPATDPAALRSLLTAAHGVAGVVPSAGACSSTATCASTSTRSRASASSSSSRACSPTPGRESAEEAEALAEVIDALGLAGRADDRRGYLELMAASGAS